MIASRLETVVWGHYTILQAQLNCLETLYNHRMSRIVYAAVGEKWKYVINLCGKELPLVTNREMVAKLMKLGGSSSIVTQPCAGKQRVLERRLTHPIKLDANGTGIVTETDKSLDDDDRPFDLSIYHKSSSYNALSFRFVEYLLRNETARRYLEFFKKTRNPEEHFYATLFHTAGVPGGFDARLKKRYFEVASSFWTKANTFQKGERHACCGRVVHRVCVVGAGDLPALSYDKLHAFFHNKYFAEYDHSVMQCLERRLVARNMEEYRQECAVS